MFENTLQDLQECYDAMDEGKELSKEEKRAKARLIAVCRDIVVLADEEELDAEMED